MSNLKQKNATTCWQLRGSRGEGLGGSGGVWYRLSLDRIRVVHKYDIEACA